MGFITSSRIITWAFFILFGFTPLFFSSQNSELFEFNKMRLVYGLTVIIVTAWIVKSIQLRQLVLRQSPFDLPILLFLGSQILSTIFSIDQHTSIWGYYSRSNGGLLSIICYITLYYALISNYKGAEVIKFLKAGVYGGLIVSLYAIPEHFGVSPSCVWLTGTWGVDCWVQLVQERVFATLGQPNWLAAYLGMIIFPTLYFFLTAERTRQKVFYGISAFLMYLAFTFTFSRGGLLGLLAGLGIFIGLIWFTTMRIVRKSKKDSSPLFANPLVQIVAAVLVINLLFGSALTGSFRLIKRDAPPARPGIVSTGGTQLENGGTESGQIRLIVWKGALEIFKHYPLFGSGVETFAYSYYQYRPAEHNLVSEWDFLYNKAHNEYLNYLATTGILGFGSYIFMIGAFLGYSMKYIVFNRLRTTKTPHYTTQHILYIALLAGYVSYLIQNFFGFSVVIIAVFFFMFPALAVAFTEVSDEPSAKLRSYLHYLNPIITSIYKRVVYVRLAFIFVILFGLILLINVYTNWEADTFYKKGNELVDSGYVGEGFNTFVEAIDLNGSEPLYRSEIGFAAAASAVSHNEVDATEAARIKNIAVDQTEKALAISPKNTSLWRTAIRTYYQLSNIDPSFDQKTLETIDQTISLAPTDPKLYYNKGLILASQKNIPEAIKALEKAVELKPDYHEAMLTLADLYYENGQKDQAISMTEKVSQQTPNDEESKKKLEKFKGLGTK